jgi:hypothetical protein
MTYSSQNSYACDPGTPRRARVWTLACIRDALPDTFVHLLLDDVAVVVSELVTYAMALGSHGVTLAVEVTDETVRVTVACRDARRNALPPGDLDQYVVSGMHLVKALATDWRMDRVDEECSELWAELSLVQARAM